MIRLCLLVFLLLLAHPAAIHADDASNTAQSPTSSSLQPTGQGLSSPQTYSLLQPAGAGSTSLQSANAGNGGVAQSGMQDIQQSGTSDQSKLLVEGDGDTPHSLAASSDYSWLGYIVLVLVATTIGTGAISLWQRRRL